MPINSIEDLVNSPANIPRNIVNAWKDRYPSGLLPFQKQALSDESFWDTSKNVVIQGPTSAGKTFMGEVLAAKAFSVDFTNCVYLVPYKAIVPDKFNAFKAIFQDYRVFCSSSDFQGDDLEIGKGNYDLAVMVYEKLLAMLADPESKVLSKCKLIVVDELQMIDDIQRGGKLEFILSRLLWEANYKNREIRIVGLGGVGSNLSILFDWLSAVKIQNQNRPVRLKEGVCYQDGTYRYRWIGIENEPESDLTFELEQLRISTDNKTSLVSQLTRQHLEKNHRILVFRGSRAQTVRTSEAIAKNLPSLAVGDDLENELKNLEETEGSKKFTHLFRKGVAYHHSGLTSEERSLVESEFSKQDGCIKVIVATETLAVGVNLPADVVILADKDRPAGSDGCQPITVESYRNCIGRAGRYGLSEQGFSYLLADKEHEIDHFWITYVTGNPTKIDSGLMKSLPKNCSDPKFKVAPFILNQIANLKSASKEDLKYFFGHTLIYLESEEDNRFSRFDRVLETSLKELEKQKLIERRGENWAILSKGEAVAKSAISIGACEAISHLLEDMKLWGDKFYAGDILFTICDCPEINESAYLGLSDREKTSTLFIKQLWTSESLTENIQVRLDSNLDKVIKNTANPSIPDSIRMKRAIVLGQWMTGISPLRIRNKIFEISKDLQSKAPDSWSVDAGHLRSIGDVMGWLIESAANLASVDTNFKNYVNPLRQLAARIQYGLPDTIIPVAKLQVKGLNRKLLIELVRNSHKAEDQSWDDYILDTPESSISFSKKVLSELREMVVDKNSKSSIEGNKIHKAEIRNLITDGVADESWGEQVASLYDEKVLGLDFEEILTNTLQKLGLDCRRIQQNKGAEPDFEVSIDGKFVHGECKISTLQNSDRTSQRHKGKAIHWREARQILSANKLGRREVHNRIVIGYDGFDETSIEMANQHELILLPLDAFVAACLWALEKETEGKVALERFLLKEKGHFDRRRIREILGQYLYPE